MITPQGPLRSLGKEEFSRFQTVINRKKLSMVQRVRGLTPPFRCRRRNFSGEIVGQNVQQLPRQIRFKRSGLRAELRHVAPNELGGLPLDAPFKPRMIFGIPAEAMDGKCIEEFVAENEAGEEGRTYCVLRIAYWMLLRVACSSFVKSTMEDGCVLRGSTGRRGKPFGPLDFAPKVDERFLLAGAAECRGFDDPIFQAIKETRAMLPDPRQDIAG